MPRAFEVDGGMGAPNDSEDFRYGFGPIFVPESAVDRVSGLESERLARGDGYPVDKGGSPIFRGGSAHLSLQIDSSVSARDIA